MEEKKKIVTDSLQIFPKARVYKTNLTKKFVERKLWRRPNPQEIKSVIPGVVTSLDVKLGGHVEEGSRLLTYEAMKMQNIVVAPFSGTVEEIFVKEGQSCPKGIILLYLKADKEISSHIEDSANAGDLGLIV